MTEKSVINWSQGVFAAIVCFLLVLSCSFIIWQWTNFYLFFKSNWIPQDFLADDLLFNTGWIKEILIQQFLLVLLFSFDPLILSIREKNFGSVTHYTRTFMFAFLGVVICIAVLIFGFNHFLAVTQEAILSEIHIQQVNLSSNLNLSNNVNRLLYLNFQYDQISLVPTTVNFPNWLEGIFGLRLFLLIIDLFAYAINGTWKFPDKVIGSLKNFFGS